jgi:hypothetical protein
MKLSDLKTLYTEACRALRQDPEDAEFKMWKCVLGSCDERDVRGALIEWWKSESGKYLPKPADLKPIADRLARIRRKVATPDFCKDSALGYVKKLIDREIVKVRCECVDCTLVWASRDDAGLRGDMGVKKIEGSIV